MRNLPACIPEIESIRSALSGRNFKSFNDTGGKRLVASSVLVPLYVHHGILHLLFNLRTEHVLHHKGQISFPGGVREAQDENALSTALRETNEEIGLPPGMVDILGRLDDVPTITGYLVSPFVGHIPYPYDFVVNSTEVAEVFGIPVKRLMEPDDYSEESVHLQGKDFKVPYFTVDGRVIWGATGRIVKNLLAAAFGWYPPAKSGDGS